MTSAPISAPIVAETNTMTRLRSEPASAALYAAGGTTTSDGKGMKELSMAMRMAIVQ